MAIDVRLPDDLERFARECVESGRYKNMSEVVRSALRLLQKAEQRRLAFGTMINEARDEAKIDSVHSLSSVAEEMGAIIASTC